MDEGDGRAVLNALLRFVGQKMLPEAKGAVIDVRTYCWCSVFRAQPRCFHASATSSESRIRSHRAASVSLVEKMVAGESFSCLHGVAGCGKTTVLQEVKAHLPSGSEMVVFDCYGAGSYLNSYGYRHRPHDAFLQLSNDLAVQMQCSTSFGERERY